VEEGRKKYILSSEQQPTFPYKSQQLMLIKYNKESSIVNATKA
jgi:hypothetical protein